MRYGFAIDNRKCIGCHACSVACKSENHVPLGVFRTFVKYVEKGRFPSSRRYFLVSRCNHCDNPPCVAICPVSAMHQRKDGIVDFDSRRCIGCKACLEACPYDAIYIDPDKGTAAKCHYCAHRTLLGLEPACVSACPAHAIVAGDLDDPDSELSRLVHREPVRVRKKEQGTSPKLYYIGAEECAIDPGAARHVGTYMWSTSDYRRDRVLQPRLPAAHSGDPIVAYDVEHARPWDWQVPVYFFTKSIASGVLLVPTACSAWLGTALDSRLAATLSLVGIAFLLLTVALLVSDLSRRERFMNVLLFPQPRSWLTRGAFLLVAYSVLLALFTMSAMFCQTSLQQMLTFPTVLGGTFAAVYTAFLCGQCEGCDHWQSPLLPLHLLVQCWIASAALSCLVPDILGMTEDLHAAATWALASGLAAHLLLALSEIVMPRATANARHAAALLTRGPLRNLHLGCALGLGSLAPLAACLLGQGISAITVMAATLSLAGLLAYEWSFVTAGQSAPNS